MRLVYMGTPQFAVLPLQSMIEAGHTIAAVVTRIDKPAGRGRTLASPPVKRAALEQGLAVFQPKRVRDPEFIETLRRIAPDAIVVAAYGQILPQEILTLPKFGCINIHASLLPGYRGAAPINWSIIRGETETGITIMQMDTGMDTGAILLQERIEIGPVDTAGTMTEKLSMLGARLIVSALPLIERNALPPSQQDTGQATLAPMLRKEDGLINWGMTALEINNRVRGLTPWPGAYTFLGNDLVKIIEADIMPGQEEPGKILAQGQGTIDVGTGHGLLRIATIQPAGKKPMSAQDFLRGHRGLSGKRFAGPVSGTSAEK